MQTTIHIYRCGLLRTIQYTAWTKFSEKVWRDIHVPYSTRYPYRSSTKSCHGLFLERFETVCCQKG